MPIILASGSPRRKELLEQAGLTFTVIPSDAEEKIEGDTPDHICENLAYIKAKDVFDKESATSKKEMIVIGADTIVWYDGEVLGKPEDEQEAFDMLNLLSDRVHQVYTGVCVIYKAEDGIHTELFHERTDVTFYPITPYELKEYIDTKDCMDKAGAYGIQGPFAVHIKQINGDYNNVVGLPIARLYQVLKNIDVK
ncbi:MAG: septum formation protein Maf [Lachnospiraceae bacterium]|nr:septum formation protein Maf [Lachnospiraceae bacterium]